MNENLGRLSTLVNERQTQIIDQWEAAVRKLPREQNLAEPLLLDHMPKVLQELSSALTGAEGLSILETSAKEHGAIRYRLGFDVEEVVAEFGLLRDVIQQFAEASGVDISGEVNRTVNHVIDKAIAVSLETYVRQQADEIERKRKEYLSFVVHDLKTPIAAMATATYVIEQKLATEAPPSIVTQMIEILRRNAARLNERVMEIINEQSRLQALIAEPSELQLTLREIDLWPIAERLKDDCQSIANSRQNMIRNDVPYGLRINADPDLLLTVLQNLLSNALKYTANGEIAIGGAENPDSIVCWVSDNGIGILPERLNEIFQKGAGDPNVPQRAPAWAWPSSRRLCNCMEEQFLSEAHQVRERLSRLNFPNLTARWHKTLRAALLSLCFQNATCLVLWRKMSWSLFVNRAGPLLWKSY